MTDHLKIKSKKLALSCISIYKELKSLQETVIANQLLRSGTSVGANIAESKFAHTRKEFIYKLSIALKECEETIYWLDLAAHFNNELKKSIPDMIANSIEIRKILIASINTTRSKS